MAMCAAEDFYYYNSYNLLFLEHIYIKRKFFRSNYSAYFSIYNNIIPKGLFFFFFCIVKHEIHLTP